VRIQVSAWSCAAPQGRLPPSKAAAGDRDTLGPVGHLNGIGCSVAVLTAAPRWMPGCYTMTRSQAESEMAPRMLRIRGRGPRWDQAVSVGAQEGGRPVSGVLSVLAAGLEFELEAKEQTAGTTSRTSMRCTADRSTRGCIILLPPSCNWQALT